MRFDFFCCLLSCGCPPIQTPYSKFEFGAVLVPSFFHLIWFRTRTFPQCSPKIGWTDSRQLTLTIAQFIRHARVDSGRRRSFWSVYLAPFTPHFKSENAVVAEWRRPHPVSTLTFHRRSMPSAPCRAYSPVVAPYPNPSSKFEAPRSSLGPSRSQVSLHLIWFRTVTFTYNATFYSRRQSQV